MPRREGLLKKLAGAAMWRGMKRIHRNLFWHANDPDEIVNSTVMTFATAKSPCFQQEWQKRNDTYMKSVICEMWKH